MNAVDRLALLAIGLALRLCPANFRRTYGTTLTRDASEELASLTSPSGKLSFALRACADIISSAAAERTANLRRDLVAAGQSMRANPGFAFVIIATLALAIGANSAVFTIVRAIALAPLPYDHQERIVVLEGLQDGLPFGFSLPDFYDVHRSTSSFEKAAALIDYPEQHGLIVDGRPHGVTLGTVTEQYFDIFGVHPVAGRFFTTSDAGRRAEQPVVIGEKLWHDVFAADPHVVGRSIVLDDSRYRVIGIAPQRLYDRAVDETHYDVWQFIPEALQAKSANRESHYFEAFALLKPGVSLQAARADAVRSFATLQTRYPQSDAHYGVGVVSLLDSIVGDVRPTLLTILLAVAGVLAIACANVANLLLGRATAREREIAVRLALGAPRGRIVSQVLTETFVYALLGGTLGFALAVGAVDAFVRSAPATIPRSAEAHVDFASLAYTAAIVLACTALAGLVPAFASSAGRSFEALRSAGRGGSSSRGARLRSALVVFEIACALALTFEAGLVVRSYGALVTRPLGFEPAGLSVAGMMEPGGARYQDPARRTALFDRTLGLVRATPGITDAAWSFSGPFLYTSWAQGFQIAGHEVPESREPDAQRDPIGPDYFALLHVPLERGRAFNDGDRIGAPAVAIVNETFVREYLPSGDAIGTRLFTGSLEERKRFGGTVTIVGVAADVRNTLAGTPKPTLYLPIAQFPPFIASLIVKSEPGVAVADVVDRAIAQADPRLVPPGSIETMNARITAAAQQTRLTMQVLTALAAVALALALAGIFSVVSFGVTLRTQEFGIRMALGAARTAILRDVVGRAMRLALSGIAAGVVLAALGTRALALTLYDVTPLDPVTFAIVVAAIAACALVAALGPAFRATQVDPAVALRFE